MNDRIKELRKTLGLTLEKFGERIGLKKSTLSLVENKKGNVTDQMFKSICREFNVNPDWLQTGEGEMFNLSVDETAAIVAELLDESTPTYNLILSIAKTYQQLDAKSQGVLDDFISKLSENIKKED